MFLARSFARVCLRRVIAPFALVSLFLSAAYANVTITANITGNTVNYEAMGLSPDSGYTVNVQHDGTGQSNNNSHTSDANGHIKGSSTAGGVALEPGDSVTVTVMKDGNPVGGVTVSVPEKEPKTWLGKLWRWIRELF